MKLSCPKIFINDSKAKFAKYIYNSKYLIEWLIYDNYNFINK